jgi:hypothetical protein
MASFTGTLDTINSGKSITQGQEAAPSFLTGLAKFASSAIPAVAAGFKNIAEDRADKTQDAAAKAMFSTFSQYQTELTAAETAEQQGAVPPGTFSTRLEATARNLMGQFPGQEAELYKYFKDNGWLPVMFKPIEEQLKNETADADLVRGNRKTAIEAATNAGFDVRTDNIAEAEAFGLKLLEADRRQAQAVAQARIEAGGSGGTGSASSQAVGDIVSTSGAAFTQRAGALLGRFQGLILAAGNDTERLRIVNEAMPTVKVGLSQERERVKASLRAVNASEDSYKFVDDQYAEYEKTIDALFSQTVGQNSQTVKILQDSFKIGSWEAATLFSQLSDVFGKQEVVNGLFNGDFISSLPPETFTQLQNEVSGLTRTMAGPGGVTREAARNLSLSNVVAILKGQTAIDDFTSEEARKKLLKPIVAATISAASNINTKEYSHEQADVYLNGARELSVAAMKLQPGEPNQVSITNAVRAVAHPTIATALRKIHNAQPDDPRVTAQIQAGRSAAQHLVIVQHTSGKNVTKDGVWEVKQDKQGNFYTQRNDAAFNREMSRARGFAEQNRLEGGDGRLEDFTQELVKPPKYLKQKVDNLNEAMGFLVRTTDLDPDVPQGATPTQYRMFYGPKSVPLKTAEGKPMVTPDEQFRQNVEAFKQDIQKGPQSIEMTPPTSFKGAKVSVGDLVSRFRAYGVPDVVAAGIIGNIDAESSFDPGAVNPTSGAFGLIQWLSKDRLANAKNNGFDLTKVEDQIDFILWELNNSEGRSKKALMSAKTPEEAANIFGKMYVRPERMPDGDIIHGNRRRKTAVAAFGAMND